MKKILFIWLMLCGSYAHGMLNLGLSPTEHTSLKKFTIPLFKFNPAQLSTLQFALSKIMLLVQDQGWGLEEKSTAKYALELSGVGKDEQTLEAFNLACDQAESTTKLYRPKDYYRAFEMTLRNRWIIAMTLYRQCQ